MSPEQALGEREVDGRSDLYSLGRGRLPHAQRRHAVQGGEHPGDAGQARVGAAGAVRDQLRRDIPTDLSRIVMRLLEKEPSDRFPNADALKAAFDGGMVTISRTDAAESEKGWPLVPTYTVPANLMLAEEESVPTADEIQQWEAPAVRTFRKKLAPYLFINGVIALFALFFLNGGLMSWTFVHTVYMAWHYAKLRDAGFDWRDVFRQPPERELIDVVEDAFAYVKRLFNPARTGMVTLRGSNVVNAVTEAGNFFLFGEHLADVVLRRIGVAGSNQQFHHVLVGATVQRTLQRRTAAVTAACISASVAAVTRAAKVLAFIPCSACSTRAASITLVNVSCGRFAFNM